MRKTYDRIRSQPKQSLRWGVRSATWHMLGFQLQRQRTLNISFKIYDFHFTAEVVYYQS